MYTFFSNSNIGIRRKCRSVYIVKNTDSWQFVAHTSTFPIFPIGFKDVARFVAHTSTFPIFPIRFKNVASTCLDVTTHPIQKPLIWPSSAHGTDLHTCSTSLTLLSLLRVKGLTQRSYIWSDLDYKFGSHPSKLSRWY